jgi:hypothetical protein
MEGSFRTSSTSAQTAEADSIVLRETATSRLVFHPMLVTNERDPEAAVRGTFTYQRKGRNDEWEDVHDLDLSKLRKGESVQLELHSGEVLRLFRGLGPLYEIYDEYGIQFGEKTYVAVAPGYWRALADDPAFRNTVFSDEELGAIRAFASWIAERPAEAAAALQALESRDLAGFDAAAGIARLQKFVSQWQANRDNPREEYWQQLLTAESWVIGLLFGAPFVIVGAKVFVGGKTWENKEGRIADFVYKNRLSGNVLIAEIKTPLTALLGQEYRQGIFPPSRELSGAVTQALDQRQTLIANYQNIELANAGAVPFNPRAVVIAGDLEQQGIQGARLRSFELYRNDLSGVEIVTFDELAAKAAGLLELFRTAS